MTIDVCVLWTTIWIFVGYKINLRAIYDANHIWDTAHVVKSEKKYYRRKPNIYRSLHTTTLTYVNSA
jgi:hypothetical protein